MSRWRQPHHQTRKERMITNLAITRFVVLLIPRVEYQPHVRAESAPNRPTCNHFHFCGLSLTHNSPIRAQFCSRRRESSALLSSPQRPFSRSDKSPSCSAKVVFTVEDTIPPLTFSGVSDSTLYRGHQVPLFQDPQLFLLGVHGSNLTKCND